MTAEPRRRRTRPRDESRLRIVQVANTLAIADGGPARNAFELNLALNRRARARLVWLHGDVGHSVLADLDPATVLPQGGPRRLGLRTSPSHRRLGVGHFIRTIATADVVISHGYYLAWLPFLGALCRLSGTPFVIMPHGSLTRHQQRASRGRKLLWELGPGRWLRRVAAGFVTGSEREARELGATFPALRVEVVGVGTSLPPPLDRTSPPTPPWRLVSVSRIARKKRIDLMIGAVGVLRYRGIPVTLTVAGVGEEHLERELAGLVDRLGLGDVVEFGGALRRSEVAVLLAGADVFLLPSDDENFGIALAEALAHGVPVVASSSVAAAQAMTGRGGAVLDAPTPQSIADAVEQLCRADAWPDFARDARRVAEEAFDWDAVARRWLEALERLTRREPR